MPWIRSLPLVLAFAVEAWGQDAAPLRLEHSAGPLRPEHFKAPVPRPLPVVNGVRIQAWAVTEFRWRYEYTAEAQAGQTSLRVTKLTVTPAFDPGSSWLADPRNPSLLDHEQGHFDITALHAPRVARELLAQVQPAAYVGATEAAARSLLEARIQAALDAASAAWRKDQSDYDAETRHGLDPRKQAEARQRQKQALANLALPPAGRATGRPQPEPRENGQQ